MPTTKRGNDPVPGNPWGSRGLHHTATLNDVIAIDPEH